MTLEDVKNVLSLESIDEIIKSLKAGRLNEPPDVEAIKKEWNPALHKTMTDKSLLPDRMVQNEDGSVSAQPVNRLAIPFQKKIVNTAVSFTFGNPVKLNAEPGDESEQLIFDAVKRLDHDCKLKSFNRRAFRELLRSTEVAELWYTVPQQEVHSTYGFDTKFRIRVAAFQPFRGDELFPYFDNTGDLIAFSRGFTRVDSDKKKIEYFEVYTETQHILWRKQSGTWVEDKNEKLIWGKIPIVFVQQEAVEWADVQICIDRLEFLVSKHAEINDYHAAPKMVATGKVIGMAKKGDSGTILEIEKGGDIKVISWDHAPESVRLEIETLLRFIHGMTQTPDISFDSVKGLHQISGESLKMLFMDAHLKVEEKREILDDFLQRRVNIQKRIIGVLANLKKASDSIEIEPEIVPFMVDDTSALIANLVTANGGKPVISQRTAIQKLGWVNDVDAELKLIQAEEEQANAFDVFEPTK